MTRLGKILPQPMPLDNAVSAVDGTHPLPTPVQKMPMGAAVPSTVVMLHVDELLLVRQLVAVAAEESPHRDVVLVATLLAAVVVMEMAMAMMMATTMAMETEITRERAVMLDVQGSTAIAPREAAA
jgi:hypothetical protein